MTYDRRTLVILAFENMYKTQGFKVKLKVCSKEFMEDWGSRVMSCIDSLRTQVHLDFSQKGSYVHWIKLSKMWFFFLSVLLAYSSVMSFGGYDIMKSTEAILIFNPTAILSQRRQEGQGRQGSLVVVGWGGLQVGLSIDSFLSTNCRQYGCRLFVTIFLII